MKILKITMIVALTLTQMFIGQSMNAQGGTVRTSNLEIAMVSSFTHVYSDKGTGSDSDLSIWKPNIPEGFYAVGHLAKAGYGQPTTSVIVVKSRKANALAYPVDYKLVWTDAGSGGNQDAAIWEPVPPAGYVALGTIVTANYNKPDLSEVVCVKAALVVQASIGNRIWTDAGSGADRDLSLWETKSSSPLYIGSGSFCGHGSHAQPDGSSVANAIKLN